MKVALLFLSLAALCSCLSADSAKVYCGRRLSNVLAALCWSSDIGKRDPELVQLGSDMGKREPELAKRSIGWWWLQGRQSLTGIRGKRGPVDECCDKPCTVDELLTYC